MAMTDHIMVVGTPNSLSGAPVEMWATIRLWVKHGMKVTVQPIDTVPKSWISRLNRLGVKVNEPKCNLRELAEAVRGPIAVAFCSTSFVLAAPQMPSGVRLVWAGCMVEPFGFEKQSCREPDRPFDAYIFESKYQMNALADFHAKIGVRPDRRHYIGAAFDVGEYFARFRLRKPYAPFVIGRISRCHPSKFTRDIWNRFATIRCRLPGPVRFRVMGWDRQITRRLTGDPPDWIECLPEGAEPVQKFLGKCHALYQCGDIKENWPRVGLEAMAAGVVLVVERRGGWIEMVEHEQSGFLTDNATQAATHLNHLMTNDSYRRRIVYEAQRRVRKLTDPDMIWNRWKQVFDKLAR